MHKKILLTLLTMSVLGMSGCSEEKPHEHTFDDKWTTNETDHWHVATCIHTELDKDLGHHIDENKDGKCDICGGDYHEHEHTFRESWSYDNDYHWHSATCEHKDLTQDFENHIDENEDHICDICNFRHPDAIAITKQPGEVHVNYPDSARMTVEVNDPSKMYYAQWQYYIGKDFEGKPRYRDVEGDAGRSLVLELPSIRQTIGDYFIFRCEIGDGTGAIFSEPGRFVVDNKTEDIDCAYFGEYAIKAGETLDLVDTPYGEGTISLNEEGNVYTFTDVKAIYKYPKATQALYDSLFVIDSDTNTHEEITINLVGENILSNPYWDGSYNAGQDVIATYFGSRAEKAKLTINGPGSLTLKGGTRLLFSEGPLEINADIDLEAFHYRLSNGINTNNDIFIKSGAHITGSVGGYGISAARFANLTIEDDAVVDLDFYPGKVMSGPTEIDGISVANKFIVGKSKIDLDFFVDTSIYSQEQDSVSVAGLKSHNSTIKLNGSNVDINIKTSSEPLKDFIYVTEVRGIYAPFIGASGAKVNIDIDAKEADRVYGFCSQATQILNTSDVTVKSVGGLETFGIFSQTNEDKDGVKIHNSNVSIDMKYAPDVVEEAKTCLFGIGTMLYDISLNETSSVAINCNGDGVAFGVIINPASKEKVEPVSDYQPVALKEENFVAQETHSININSYRVSKYVVYETFVDSSSLAPLSSVTLVSPTK